MPAISVIMPVYNTAQYLDESISSILNQTFSDFEFIIINDGSTDDSDMVIRKYDDSRIRYIHHQNNTGYVPRLNEGLKLAQGTYIARMDSDDMALSQRFEKQVAIMEQYPDVIVCGSDIEIFGKRTYRYSYSDHFIMTLLNTPFQHSAVMMRTAYFRKYNVEYDIQRAYYEDYKLWVDIYAQNEYRSSCFYHIKEVLTRYRAHTYQVSSRFEIAQATGKLDLRRQYLIDFLAFFGIAFSFQQPRILTKKDLISLEAIFNQLYSHKKVIAHFSAAALDEFRALAVYWLYVSYPSKSIVLWTRFILRHGLNMHIPLEHKIKTTLHLWLGRPYKKRF